MLAMEAHGTSMHMLGSCGEAVMFPISCNAARQAKGNPLILDQGLQAVPFHTWPALCCHEREPFKPAPVALGRKGKPVAQIDRNTQTIP